jgi:hypothetical protein
MKHVRLVCQILIFAIAVWWTVTSPSPAAFIALLLSTIALTRYIRKRPQGNNT